jgi:integrase
MKARDFGPSQLKIVREALIDKGLTRTYINGQIERLRRVVRWAVSEELVQASVLTALETVSGLRFERSDAREPTPVKPVPREHVEAILPHLSSTVRAMVQLQMLTGARSGELALMRAVDIDTSGSIWVFKPTQHKNRHRGHTRSIFIGPRGQDVLIPLLVARARDAYVFSPCESAQEYRDRRREARKTPASYGNAPGTNRKTNPRRAPGEFFSRDAYRAAVVRACKQAGVPRWTPHQLRHSVGTWVRSEYGIEGAQIVLGHRKCDVTQVYSERDEAKALQIAEAIG